MNKATDTGLTLLTMAMTLVAVGAVGRAIWSHAAPRAASRPEVLDTWREYASGPSRFGPTTAQVTIVVFSDFQCPFCQQFAASYADVTVRHPGKLQMVFRHHPLNEIHPAAAAAARAATCAAFQGRFESMHNALFAKQDSIEALPMTRFATDAGLVDLEAFSACIASHATDSLLAADSADADRLQIRGTPAILVNEHLVRWNPGTPLLDSLVVSALGGN